MKSQVKIGAFYNFFDGEELIEKSILSIRKSVDYICVVWQETSNYGNKGNIKNIELLNRLYDEKIIDECFYGFNPDLNKHPHFNEIEKRNLGLELCKKRECTHIISMDADEFYIKEHFDKAKKEILDNDYETSAFDMQTFFKKPIYKINPPEKYYVPFIQKINKNSKYVLNSPFPVLVDPTRRLDHIGKTKIFKRKEIEMYHMSFVRKNINSKIMNSSAKCNFKNPEAYIEFFNKWEKGVKNFHPSNPKEFRDVKIVENIFGIDI